MWPAAGKWGFVPQPQLQQHPIKKLNYRAGAKRECSSRGNWHLHWANPVLGIVLLNSHCNCIDGEVQVEWGRHNPVQTMPWKLSWITGINLSGYLSCSPFCPGVWVQLLGTCPSQEAGREMLPGPAVNPRALMWAVKWNRGTAGSRKQHLVPFQRHFSSVLRTTASCIPWPCVWAQGWEHPSSAAGLGSAGGEHPPCAAHGQRLRGVCATPEGKVKSLEMKVVEKMRISNPRIVDNASSKAEAE